MRKRFIGTLSYVHFLISSLMCTIAIKNQKKNSGSARSKVLIAKNEKNSKRYSLWYLFEVRKA